MFNQPTVPNLTASAPHSHRLPWLLALLVAVALLALGVPTRLLTHVAYAVEKGRIDAASENLGGPLELAQAFRSVVQVARPGVVSISVGPGRAQQERLVEIQKELGEIGEKMEQLEQRLSRENRAKLSRSELEKAVDERDELRAELDRLLSERAGMVDDAHPGTGSGIVVDDAGYILTNNHVVEGHGDIQVRLSDDRSYAAERVGTDPKTDLALLLIDAPDLHPIRFGDSSKAEVGDFVLAIGAPFGLSHSVTHGIISAKGRTDIATARQILYQDFIQTDAAVNPGNSGGPLVNLSGEVIGVNTAIATDDGRSAGVAFTIPSNLAARVARELKEHGAVARGWMGILLADLVEEDVAAFGLKDRQGVMVNMIYEDSPAHAAGIQCEDVILSVNGTRVGNLRQLQATVADLAPLSPARLELIRDQKAITIEVVLGRQPDNINAATRALREIRTRELPRLGVEARTLRPLLPFPAPVDVLERRGVLVTELSNRNVAGEFAPFDVVVRLDGKDVSSVADLAAQLSSRPGGARVTFEVVGLDGAARAVELKLAP